MNKGVAFIFGLAIGAAAGVAGAWKFFKNKYEKIAQEEIDSVIEKFTEMKQTKSNQSKPEKEEVSEQDLKEFASLVHDEGYFNYASIDNSEATDKKEVGVMSKPYVIPPEEFGEKDDYDAVSLNYYADEVLTDDFDERIEDVEGLVGEDSLTHFGEYEDDSVFVRNDRLKTDFEILLDTQYYSDIVKKKAHQMEDK
mgnify:CR=1 FL=1